MALEVKNPPANAGDLRDVSSVPGSECGAIFSAHLGAGNGNSLQDSCLGNPMDREAWQAEVHGVAEQT